MSVVTHTNAAGDMSLGVEVEGAFVPFVTLSRAKVAQYVQRYHEGVKRIEAGGEGAQGARDALGSAYQPKGKPKAKTAEAL